ncbi:MAG TPA: efflux RND transporter periplasmic adaptor subunit, partial [Pseudomonadaceae bacterium]|nr:efflux RND transporter periplasmic adaptor subunit [Pseudomonadaceae bacterium]
MRLLSLLLALTLPLIVQAQADTAPAVIVQEVTVQVIEDPELFTARVEAIETVDIRARVQGFIRAVAFEAGQSVDTGDLLFEIEPELYEAAVASARAQLAGAEADRVRAERQLARAEDLRKRDIATQAILDEAYADNEAAIAAAGAAEAALIRAELDLSYTRIEAPIPGEIGRAVLTVGNLVGPESGSLARIVQPDPVRVVFSIPEGMLVSLRQEARGILPDTGLLRLTLRLPNGTVYDRPGRIEYVASEVDLQTGTIAVRSIFENPQRWLVPGQFVTMYVNEAEPPELPVVPQAAVLQDREGRFVFVLLSDNTVAQRRI